MITNRDKIFTPALEPEIGRVTITPEMAQSLLQRNTKNRTIRSSQVEFLAKQMREGKWKFNGDAIRLDGDRLLDGQHRLMACVMAKTAFDTIIIKNLDSDCFETIDCGARRTSADVLGINGEKNAHNLAAALRFIHQYLNGFRNKTGTMNTEIMDLLDEHPDVRRSVAFCHPILPKRLIPLSIFSGSHYFCQLVDRPLADRFFEGVATGSNLLRRDPALVLRTRLIDNMSANKKHDNVYLTALLIKAWNAEYNRRKISHLSWRPRGDNAEKYPTFAGLEGVFDA